MKGLPLNSDLQDLSKEDLINLVQELQLELMSKRAGPVSNDEQICLQQIKLLTEKSYERELDLDETKRFEIFSKNLRAIRGQVVDGSKKGPKPIMSTAKLLEIAGE
jgi:hypothetical protein